MGCLRVNKLVGMQFVILVAIGITHINTRLMVKIYNIFRQDCLVKKVIIQKIKFESIKNKKIMCKQESDSRPGIMRQWNIIVEPV